MEIANEKITEKEILKNWDEYILIRLVDILNKDYLLEDAIEDIKSFRIKSIKFGEVENEK